MKSLSCKSTMHHQDSDKKAWTSNDGSVLRCLINTFTFQWLTKMYPHAHSRLTGLLAKLCPPPCNNHPVCPTVGHFLQNTRQNSNCTREHTFGWSVPMLRLVDGRVLFQLLNSENALLQTAISDYTFSRTRVLKGRLRNINPWNIQRLLQVVAEKHY